MTTATFLMDSEDWKTVLIAFFTVVLAPWIAIRLEKIRGQQKTLEKKTDILNSDLQANTMETQATKKEIVETKAEVKEVKEEVKEVKAQASGSYEAMRQHVEDKSNDLKGMIEGKRG